jgi:hypothetical protein
VIGIGEAFGELVVVGQEEESAGIEVEPSYGRDERVYRGYQIVDSGAALGIFEGGDVARGLVEQDVQAVLRLEGLVIEEDLVAVEIDPLVRVFNDASVDLDAPAVDPASGLGAGAESGFGDDAIESFCFQCRTTLARPVLPPLSATRMTSR